MGLHSYSQPSLSDDYGDTSDQDELSPCDQEELIYEELIRRDQEELSRREQEELILQYGETARYPPQPEVEFGFPQTCYCDGEPLLATSYTRNDPGRRYYTCQNVDDGECHIWKWWDVAVMEEMSATDKRILLLEEKVDNLNFLNTYDTDEKVQNLEKLVSDLAKKKSSLIDGFEVFVGVMLVLLVVIGLVIVFK
ncbi:GRF-type domain-containing protein [Raphanus sativus]|nr:GRF-type domain-containing protein [Raphanus sativus]